MSRGVGVESALARALEPAEPLLALLTQLGDAWFLVSLGVALYWLGERAPLAGWDRRRGLVVLGAALLALATTYLLKALFGLPRPPGAGEPAYALEGPAGLVYADIATATGSGFPSGHAVESTAVYGTVAWLGGEPNDRRRRLAVAAGLVGLVSLTRVGLGLHYVADVVVGAAVGTALVALAIRVRTRPGIVLGAAVATVGLRAGVGPVSVEAGSLLGLTAGTFVGWWLARTRGRRDAVARGAPWALAFGVLGASGVLALTGQLTVGVTLAGFGGGLAAVALPARTPMGEK